VNAAVLSPSPPSPADGWRATLDLGFAVIAGRTALVRNRHLGPLSVQRAFYPEPGGVAHVYLLHPPGGVVGGDILETSVQAAPDAHALITTPAATKFYRSAGRAARQSQRLRVASGASLEWLPQETIVFGGAQVRTETRVELEPGARFLGWDIVCLGRPASGDDFSEGSLSQTFEIWSGGAPLFIERSHFDAHEKVQSARWGLAGRRVFGSLVCAGVHSSLVAELRGLVPFDPAEELFSVTQARGALVCRYLGQRTERARALFQAAWAVLRPPVLERRASPPRIWLT